MQPAPTPFYYASGQRVELELDHEHTALDLSQASAAQRKALQPLGRAVSATVLLLNSQARAHVHPASTPGALPLPVFKSGAALLVALPEVRVEDDDPAALARVVAWLCAEPGHGSVTDKRAGRLTLRAGPALHFGAVTLAREAVERCQVASASPRLLRVVPVVPGHQR